MVKWKFVYTKQVQKDAKKIKVVKLKEKTLKILKIIQEDPYQSAPPFEKLVGDLTGAYSRRINIKHRIVYQVLEDIQIVKIIRMLTHHE
jgi:Txe/YoeB family toxin of toxin-antitoxin system